MNYEIYSIECYRNFFCYTGYDYTHDCYYQFSIGCGKNDIVNLHKHLLSNIMQIGFNNLCIFYPVLHNFIQNFTYYKQSPPDYVASIMKMFLDDIIQQDGTFIKDGEKYIRQIDLFRILHYNNKSRATSLSDIKFHLGMNIIPKPNIETVMPGDVYDILLHSTNNTQAIVGLFNTVIGKTNNPYYKDRNIIQMRFNIKNKLNIPCINYSDSKLGEQIVIYSYCRKKNIEPSSVKELRTNRYFIDFSECVPNLEFINNDFNKLKSYYSNFKMTDPNEKPEYKIHINNIVLSFGAGGIHSNSNSSKYISDDEYTYLDLDISGYYPSIICKLGIHPSHFDSDFTEIYKSEILEPRFKELDKDNPNLTIVETFKKACNSCFGKMGDPDSPLYDYLAFYKTVVGAQFYTAYWIDKLTELFDIDFVFVNTDGMLIKVKRCNLDNIISFNNSFSNTEGFRIKQKVVHRLFVKDINNYVLQYADGTYKTKGLFEFYKEFHKDPSSKIVSIALFNYFIKDIPFERTIKEWKYINEFCIRIKSRSNSKTFYNNQEIFKTNRYYVSTNSSNNLFKDVKGNKEPINSLYHQTLLNKITSRYSSDYDIDFRYYIQECRKISDSILVKQLELF